MTSGKGKGLPRIRIDNGLTASKRRAAVNVEDSAGHAEGPCGGDVVPATVAQVCARAHVDPAQNEEANGALRKVLLVDVELLLT